MATLNLRRFSNPEALKSIERDSLLEFLNPHGSFFSSQGLSLPSNSSGDAMDFNHLSSILKTPKADTPKDLAGALYIINEMATPKGCTTLSKAERAQHSLPTQPSRLELGSRPDTRTIHV